MDFGRCLVMFAGVVPGYVAKWPFLTACRKVVVVGLNIAL
jgi:hypothetical protein